MIGSIENRNSVLTTSANPARALQSGSVFASAMTAASSSDGGNASTKPSPSVGSTASDDSPTKLKEALAAFKKEISLTPAERARRDVLKSMKLTEDSIKAMPPEQRKATEQKIADEVARRLRLSDGKEQAASSAGPSALTI